MAAISCKAVNRARDPESSMKNVIYVNYLSRFANNIFQYALAHIIRDLIDGEIRFSPDCILRIGESHDRPAEKVPIQDIPLYRITDSSNILVRPEWSGKFREEEKAALRRTGIHFAEDILTVENGKVGISSAYRGEPIILAGYYQNFAYYKGRKDYVAGLLSRIANYPPPKLPGANDIVLNFRGTDMSWAQMPPSFYKRILDGENFDKLWIVTEDPGHKTVRKLLEFYSGELFSDSPITDFRFVMSARKIIITVSTFCWMAAWLSNAEKIYFPLGSPCDLFDRNNDKRLIVTDDPRYVYMRHRFGGMFLLNRLPFYHREYCP